MSRSTWILIFIAIFFGIIFWSLASQEIESQAPYYIKFATLQTTTVEFNGVKINAEVVRSVKAMTKGLSGRDSLPADKGMLFVFSTPAVQTITMQGMKFSIDIIWIMDNKVVDLTNGAQVPDVNTNTVPKYQSSQQVNYILEVNNRFISENKIKIGDEVKISLQKSQ
jgi:hypothetical protein